MGLPERQQLNSAAQTHPSPLHPLLMVIKGEEETQYVLDSFDMLSIYYA